ncbi:hypothetical protein FQN54_001829 [Arachnomyces sp. PD_36]|nr:hypothetical protein FQN54_001829 [Arachnomyces sp. PD_36]
MASPFLAINSMEPEELGTLKGEEKAEEVARLMKILREDLKRKHLVSPQRVEILQNLRVHCRKKDDASALYSKDGIDILCKYGFDKKFVTTSREALRCVANALLNDPDMRQHFVDLNYACKAAERYKEPNSDDEFLISRLLFLTTYGTNINFDPLFNNQGLGDSINNHVARHAKKFAKGKKKPLSVIDETALSETLKLLFNITNFYPHRATDFTPSIPNIFKILSYVDIPSPPLQSPVNYLINALLNLDLESEKKHFGIGTNPLFPKFDQNHTVDKLINILDQAIALHEPKQLETEAIPLLTLLRKVHEIAPESPKKYMQWLLLPDNDARDQPIGKSNTLSSRLLRLSTSPVAPTLRDGISKLMFELSESDANTFVKNVGYGFAAGFLLSHDMPVPESAKEAFSTSAEGHGAANSENTEINPITGQRFDAEPKDTGPEMTQAEKEREAEKLFVLFERLKATGVVDVKNPLQQAVEEGRFEELDDDDDSDDSLTK